MLETTRLLAVGIDSATVRELLFAVQSEEDVYSKPDFVKKHQLLVAKMA
ncbi:hypothetical protein N9A45_00200 [bacterium]|nr:hypothetical protein [bacterium]